MEMRKAKTSRNRTIPIVSMECMQSGCLPSYNTAFRYILAGWCPTIFHGSVWTQTLKIGLKLVYSLTPSLARLCLAWNVPYLWRMSVKSVLGQSRILLFVSFFLYSPRRQSSFEYGQGGLRALRYVSMTMQYLQPWYEAISVRNIEQYQC